MFISNFVTGVVSMILIIVIEILISSNKEPLIINIDIIQKQNYAVMENIYQLYSNVPQLVICCHLQAVVNTLVKFCQ